MTMTITNPASLELAARAYEHAAQAHRKGWGLGPRANAYRMAAEQWERLARHYEEEATKYKATDEDIKCWKGETQ